MKLKVLVTGISILFIGIVLIAFSQTTVYVPAKKNEKTVAEINIAPNSNTTLTVLANFTRNETFIVGAPITRDVPENIPGGTADVFTNITDPLGYSMERYITLEANTQSATPPWLAYPGDWNGTSIANHTGTYRISVTTEPPMRLVKLTVKTRTIDPAQTLTPDAYAFYPGIAVGVAGFVLTLYGTLGGVKIRKARRAKLGKL